MMKLLLDTHAFIWWVSDPEKPLAIVYPDFQTLVMKNDKMKYRRVVMY